MEVAPDRKRVVSIYVYDLQGGPFPEAALQQLERDVEKVAQAYNGLAISVIQE
jgi:hypothetical protein